MGSALLTFAIALAASLPPTGAYTVVEDTVRVDTTGWNPLCGEPSAPRTLPIGQAATVVSKGTGIVVKAGSQAFGTGACQGTNPSLRYVGASKVADGLAVACRSQRVVRGTEELTHTLRGLPGDLVEIRTKSTQMLRASGQTCTARATRRTVLHKKAAKALPAPRAEAPQAAPRETTAAPACRAGKATAVRVRPTTSLAAVGGRPVCLRARAFDKDGCRLKKAAWQYTVSPSVAGQIDSKGCLTLGPAARRLPEVVLTARVGDAQTRTRVKLKRAPRSHKAAAARVPELAIQVVNHMGNTFVLKTVEIRIDGKLYKPRSLDGKGPYFVFDGPLKPGTHQLETRLIYRGNGNGLMSYLSGYTFKLKKRTRLTIKPRTRTTVRVVGYEDGDVTLPLNERPRIRLDVVPAPLR